MKPVQHAVSFVTRADARPGVEGEDPRILVVRRPPDDEDLPGAWGLPAGSVRPGETHVDAVRRAGREKLGVELEVGPVLAEGETERDAYVLRMKLFAARIRDGVPRVPQPVEDVTQYTARAWTPPERLRPAAARGSLCSRLCLEWMGGQREGDG